MNIRTKRNIIIFAIYPVLGFSIGYIGVAIHWIFALLIFPLSIYIQYITSKLRCPKCNIPVGWHKYKIFIFEFNWWSPITKKICEHCGYHF